MYFAYSTILCWKSMYDKMTWRLQPAAGLHDPCRAIAVLLGLGTTSARLGLGKCCNLGFITYGTHLSSAKKHTYVTSITALGCRVWQKQDQDAEHQGRHVKKLKARTKIQNTRGSNKSNSGAKKQNQVQTSIRQGHRPQTTAKKFRSTRPGYRRETQGLINWCDTGGHT